MDHCDRCGTLMEDGALFCPQCGAKRRGSDAPADTPEHPFRGIVLFCLAWAGVTWLIYANLAHHNWVALTLTAGLSLVIVAIGVGSFITGMNINRAAEKINKDA